MNILASSFISIISLSGLYLVVDFFTEATIGMSKHNNPESSAIRPNGRHHITVVGPADTGLMDRRILM